MDAKERLQTLGVWGTLRQLAYGTGTRAGVEVVNLPRYTKRVAPTYKKMINTYLAEGRVKCAIDELSDISVGGGMYTTCKEGYEEQKQELDYFFEDVDLDYSTGLVARELWAIGNGLIWLKTPRSLKNVVRVPMITVRNLDSDPISGVPSEILQYTETRSYHQVSTKACKQLRHLSWNAIDTGVWGRGLLEPYVRSGVGYKWKSSDGKWKTAYRPPLCEIIEEIEDMMRVAIVKYAPKYFFDLMGFSEEEAQALSTKMNLNTWYDDIILYYQQGKKGEKQATPHRLSTDPRSRLDPFIEHFVNKELISMETPSVKLISESGFTEASSRTAIEIEARKVSAFQRFLKRRYERFLVWPFLQQKFKWGPEQIREAEIRIHWGEETKPQIAFEDLHQARVNKGISLTEYRDNLTKFGFELDTKGRSELDAEIAAQEALLRQQEREKGKDEEE